MKKAFLTFGLFLLIALYSDSFAQYKNVWKRGKMTFETSEKLDITPSKGDGKVFDADTKGLGISMEIVDWDDEPDDFLANIELGCKQICEDMTMKFVNEGSPFLKNYKSYYVVCYDDEPVVTAVIMRPDIKKVYEISIWCYEDPVEVAVKILKSIQFTK